jgi:hypothetical protein
VRLFDAQKSYYEQHRDAAAAMASSEHKVAQAGDIAELAAWTVVSNVLLNLDETLTK